MHDAPEVGTSEDGASARFVVGDRVYKLMMPTADELGAPERLELRRRRCEEDVRVGRRAAPNVYLGVLPVTRDADGSLWVDGTGEVVDWLVEMAHLAPEASLESRLARRALQPVELHAIAWALARFHHRAVTGPSVNQHGLPRVAVERALASIEAVAAARPQVLSPAALEHLRGRAGDFLAQRRELLERRVAGWHIREGHGDLRADKVWLDDGEALFIEPLDGERALRCDDSAADVAALVGELEHRGDAEAGERLLQEYAELRPDPEIAAVLPLYGIRRGCERVSEALRQACEEGLEPVERAACIDEAERIAQLTLGRELPQALVLVEGERQRAAPVASYLASRLRAALVSGAAPQGNGRSTNSEPPRAPGDLLAQALAALSAGRSVVADLGAQGRPPRRLLEEAARLGVPQVVLRLDGPTAAANEDRRHPPFVEQEASARLLPMSTAASPVECCRALQERLLAEVRARRSGEESPDRR